MRCTTEPRKALATATKSIHAQNLPGVLLHRTSQQLTFGMMIRIHSSAPVAAALLLLLLAAPLTSARSAGLTKPHRRLLQTTTTTVQPTAGTTYVLPSTTTSPSSGINIVTDTPVSLNTPIKVTTPVIQPNLQYVSSCGGGWLARLLCSIFGGQ
jgi:hypothetical protein